MKALILLCCIVSMSVQAQICHEYTGEDPHPYYFYKTEATDAIGLANTANYNLIYQRLSVKVNPAIRYIDGVMLARFIPLQPIDTLALDLSDSLRVDSVYYHSNRIPFSHTKNAFQIAFTPALTAIDSITIYYQGVPHSSGFGSYNLQLHDSIPVLWTLSEPYGGRDWFPCKMTLTDKVDSLDMYITVPTGNQGISNGLLMDTLPIDSHTRYHWQHRYPIANYLICMAVTNYATVVDTVSTIYGPVRLAFNMYPEHRAGWQDGIALVKQVMAFYSTRFGPYPFIHEHYGETEFSWGGGMEHQSNTFIAGLGYELLAHEMAHQWFGDKLTCHSWADIWLNEGFATYLSYLCYERYFPNTLWITSKQQSNFVATYLPTGSVRCMDTTTLSSIFNAKLSYRKGARLLHQLRWVVGDSAFFSGLYHYVMDTTLTYSFTKTELLRTHIEQSSGMNLLDYFDKWYAGSGYASYHLDWTQHDAVIDLKLSQQTSDPSSVTFFPLPVPIKCYGAGIDTILVLSHTASGQQFSYSLPFEVDYIQIDPDLWLISKDNTVRRVPALNTHFFVTLFPNPGEAQCTIWYDSQSIHSLSYTIYTATGQQVKKETITPTSDYYIIPTTDFAAGIYYVHIASDGATKNLKWIKH